MPGKSAWKISGHASAESQVCFKDGAADPDAAHATITRDDMRDAWRKLNAGPEPVELVALGSPHYSLTECERLSVALAGRTRHAETQVIVTAGHQVLAAAQANGQRQIIGISKITRRHSQDTGRPAIAKTVPLNQPKMGIDEMCNRLISDTWLLKHC